MRKVQVMLLIIIAVFVIRIYPLTTVGEIYDGTPRDIAAGKGVIYLAQGRYVSLINPETGLRIANFHNKLFPHQVNAVEYDLDEDVLFAATSKAIYIYDVFGESSKIWEVPNGSITDFKYISQDKIIIAVVNPNVFVIDYGADEPVVISQFSTPEGILFYDRLHIAATRNGKMVYLAGALAGQTIRGVNGLIIANLDSENNYAQPYVYPSFWNPVIHYGSAAASVRNIQVVENYNADFTYAFVACGLLGQLTMLDVTDPESITFVERIVLAPDFQVFNLLLDDDESRLFAASMNILHIINLRYMEVLGSLNVGFFDAGDRDMTIYHEADDKYIWTATHFSVDYVINAVNVTTNRPVHVVRQWWISSSDGAVAAPQWNSVYLPTFGGIVRYDVSDETNPIAIDESYQPARGTIEHIHIMYPDPDNLDYALLLTAPGNGGIQYWEVSLENPDPAPPVKVVQKPARWGNDPVYQNDVGYFQKDGVIYFLADLANRATNEIALQIYNTEEERWTDIFVQNDSLSSNAKSIAVSNEYAFVSCTGGFFVVDLSHLPRGALVTDVVINDWNRDGRPDDVAAIVVSPDAGFIYIAHDPGVIQSYEFDAATGKVTGPISQLYGEGISGCTSRGRYYDESDRVYIAGRGGKIMEIDVQDPYHLKLLSVWNNSSYNGEMQDCRIYDFGNGPRLLAVKNNEGFAILKFDELSRDHNYYNTETVPAVNMKQNYPNPFNPETVIEFSIKEETEAQLVIYNLAGQIVRTLHNGMISSGDHNIKWDGKNEKGQAAASGVYLYRLITDNYDKVNKMLLVK